MKEKFYIVCVCVCVCTIKCVPYFNLTLIRYILILFQTKFLIFNSNSIRLLIRIKFRNKLMQGYHENKSTEKSFDRKEFGNRVAILGSVIHRHVIESIYSKCSWKNCSFRVSDLMRFKWLDTMKKIAKENKKKKTFQHNLFAKTNLVR